MFIIKVGYTSSVFRAKRIKGLDNYDNVIGLLRNWFIVFSRTCSFSAYHNFSLFLILIFTSSYTLDTKSVFFMHLNVLSSLTPNDVFRLLRNWFTVNKKKTFIK